MKKHTVFENFIAALGTAVLAFCLSAGGLMCLVTAFDLPVAKEGLLGGLALISLVMGALFQLNRSWIPVLCLWVLGLGYLLFFQRAALLQGIFVLITRLGTLYSSAYGLHIPDLPVEPWDSCTLPLLLWGACVVWLTAWVLERRQSLLPSLLFASIPLALCLVVIDTPPDLQWLLLFISTAVLLLLTQSSRRLSLRDGRRLMALILVPVLALTMGLHALLPMEGYRRGGFGQQVLNALVELSSKVLPVDVDSMGALDVRIPVAQSESLDVGPRRDSNRVAMEVKAAHSGITYLRGMTYGVYTGNSWELLPEELYTDLEIENGLTTQLQVDVQYMSIRPRSREAILYTPYYLSPSYDEGTPVVDAYVENTGNTRLYEMPYYNLPSLGSNLAAIGTYLNLADPSDSAFTPEPSEYEEFVYEYYTQLPADTRNAALELARSWGLDASSTRSQIAQIVSLSAVYDLETAKMPSGADFAIWFLKESDTGYCVHFASAATVMLRALGCPARYVTGYLTQTEADQWTTVTQESAHAWCEYYWPGIGWLPLEATPPEGVASTMDPDLRPEPTEETTVPSAPTEETEPHEPTTPEETTSPTTTSKPNQPKPSQGNQTEQRELPTWLWWLLGAACAVALLFLRRPLVLRLRKGDRRIPPKRLFLHRWQADCRVASRLGLPIRLEHLAEKACFSQHEPAPEDLAQLQAWEDELQNALSAAPWYRRFYLRWVLILL